MSGAAFLRALGRVLAGSLLLLALAALFAWWLFPGDFVRQLPERALNRALPRWQWQVGAARWRWPGWLELRQIRAQGHGGGDLIVERLSLQPEWSSFLRGRQWRLAFAAELAGGTVTGRASAHGDSALSCSAEVQSLDLAGQPWLGRMLGRELKGRLSGTLAAQFEMRSGLLSALEGRLSAQDGAIPLRHPVLGHEVLPYARISTRLRQDGRQLVLTSGTLESPLGQGSFAGAVTLAWPAAASRISMQGQLKARPELFARVREQPEWQVMRLEAGSRPLAVMLSGTLADPALAFSPLEPAPAAPASLQSEAQGTKP